MSGRARCLRSTPYLDRLLACNKDAQPRRGSETLLTSSQDNIQSPGIESDLFACNCAYSIRNNLHSCASANVPTGRQNRCLPEYRGRPSSRSPRFLSRPTRHLQTTYVNQGIVESYRCNEPVEVSTWVKVTTLYCFVLSAASRSDSATASPNGAVISSTFAPYVRKLLCAAARRVNPRTQVCTRARSPVCEAIAKVAAVKDKCVLAGLYEVGGNLPAGPGV